MSWKKEMVENIVGQKCLELVIKSLMGHLSMTRLRKKIFEVIYMASVVLLGTWCCFVWCGLFSALSASLNEIHFHNQDQLQAEIAKTHLENEAFVTVFGKEHGGFARSMGLGVTPSQLTTTRSARLTTSSEANEKMKEMQAEIDSLKDKASQFDILKEHVAFLLQMHNSKENQVTE
ncbi:uncharacterized protein LOC123883466 isoform X1 [Trifolium pratense]|uniref:uncharacterized protein LOC123883466 isoform X1 n=1 Tax=Trifolium pratense TaxID=57577 RepID=UPI001E691158|nr:uncharacterized protein LOC123883466 isoform X1 [Trifolium pratense]